MQISFFTLNLTIRCYQLYHVPNKVILNMHRFTYIDENTNQKEKIKLIIYLDSTTNSKLLNHITLLNYVF